MPKKEVCSHCRAGWEPIETSAGRAHLAVIGDEPDDPPMVNVILDEPTRLI